MIGTLINVVAILLGAGLGCLAGDRLPKKTRETVMAGLGLVTLLVGLQMALTTRNVLVVMACILVGAVLGEWWNLEGLLERLGAWFEAKLPAKTDAAPEHSVSRAFVTASLVFCVGPMAILGAVNDGLTGDFKLLAIKSMLDGFCALAFGASLGPGVLLSALSVGVYQGGMSLATMLFAGALGHVAKDNPMIVEMTATGGVLIVAIALLLLDVKKIRVANLLPAVALAPLLVWALTACGVKL